MDTNTDHLRQTVNLLSLVAQDTNLKKVGANWYAGPCPFCGGKDRFVVKQTPQGWRWLCRHCTDGRYLDAIDYIQRREGLDFKAAVEWLGGQASSALRREVSAKVDKPPRDSQAEETRTNLCRLAFDASRRIDETDDKLVAVVRNYLYRRGFAPPTLDFALLGAAERYDPKAERMRPAVSIPYFNRDLDVRAVKFRFVDDEPDGLRYIAAKGSVNDFYWLPERFGYYRRLLVLEGELNLLSVAQTQPEIDLISTGSQSVTTDMESTLRKISRRYERVFIWMDDGDKAQKLVRLVERGKAFKSPVVGGVKYDANRMLQDDLLREFIGRAFEVRCSGWTLKEWRAQYDKAVYAEKAF